MSVHETRPGRYSVKLRVAPGPDGRQHRALPAGLSRAEAEDRDATIARLIEGLRQAGQEALIGRVVDELVTCERAEWARLVAYVDGKLIGGQRTPIRDLSTVRQVGELWTSGELARRYPDHVKVKRSAQDDRERLEGYVYPVIGDVPIASVTLDHAEAVMAAIPTDKRTGTRRQVGQVLRRLLALAVFPLRLRAEQPIPRGFLPRPSKTGFLWLYPTEEALLLGDRRIPLERRLAYGVLCREGMRAGDLAGLEWPELDLDRGVINLGAHKTSAHTGARSWVLRPDTAEALRWWHAHSRRSSGPVLRISLARLSEQLRRDLGRLPVRRELLEGQAGRRSLRAHDLRGSFVTVALAGGRSEAWVTDRTGHTSSTQLAAYRRAARSAVELSLGDWRPLLEVLWTGAASQPVHAPGAESPSLSRKDRLVKAIFSAVSAEGRGRTDTIFGRRILNPQSHGAPLDLPRDLVVEPLTSFAGDSVWTAPLARVS